MSLPLLVAVLQVLKWKCPRLVSHDFLDVVHSSKLTTFEVEFEFREKEQVTRSQIRRALGLRKRWNTIFGQNFVQGDVIVARSIVVVQQPLVRSLWPDTMNPYSESFKGLTIVLFSCLSLRHEFLSNNTLTLEKEQILLSCKLHSPPNIIIIIIIIIIIYLSCSWATC